MSIIPFELKTHGYLNMIIKRESILHGFVHNKLKGDSSIRNTSFYSAISQVVNKSRASCTRTKYKQRYSKVPFKMVRKRHATVRNLFLRSKLKLYRVFKSSTLLFLKKIASTRREIILSYQNLFSKRTHATKEVLQFVFTLSHHLFRITFYFDW